MSLTLDGWLTVIMLRKDDWLDYSVVDCLFGWSIINFFCCFVAFSTWYSWLGCSTIRPSLLYVHLSLISWFLTNMSTIFSVFLLDHFNHFGHFSKRFLDFRSYSRFFYSTILTTFWNFLFDHLDHLLEISGFLVNQFLEFSHDYIRKCCLAFCISLLLNFTLSKSKIK